ncbi:MAG: hypothetical protein KDK36_00650 [Leptospiraceae bacterium]|nr:hypothetical protein [Leptospiraceae bacterium]
MNFIKKFFRFLKSPDEDVHLDDKKLNTIKKPLGFQMELKELKQKLSDFLLTNKINSGLVVSRNQYKLLKTGQFLYKLEGKEKSGREFSIVISTGNFLNLKDGKISGILQVTEGELNKAIQSEYGSLEGFLNKFKNLELGDKSLEAVTGKKNKFSWKEILLWDRFWQEQLFLRLRPSYVAILIVSLDDSFSNLFLNVTSSKQKKIVDDELFYLNQGVNSEESNPYTKNLNLIYYEEAYKELKEKIELLKFKQEKEN